MKVQAYRWHTIVSHFLLPHHSIFYRIQEARDLFQLLRQVLWP